MPRFAHQDENFPLIEGINAYERRVIAQSSRLQKAIQNSGVFNPRAVSASNLESVESGKEVGKHYDQYFTFHHLLEKDDSTQGYSKKASTEFFSQPPYENVDNLYNAATQSVESLSQDGTTCSDTNQFGTTYSWYEFCLLRPYFPIHHAVMGYNFQFPQLRTAFFGGDDISFKKMSELHLRRNYNHESDPCAEKNNDLHVTGKKVSSIKHSILKPMCLDEAIRIKRHCNHWDVANSIRATTEDVEQPNHEIQTNDNSFVEHRFQSVFVHKKDSKCVLSTERFSKNHNIRNDLSRKGSYSTVLNTNSIFAVAESSSHTDGVLKSMTESIQTFLLFIWTKFCSRGFSLSTKFNQAEIYLLACLNEWLSTVHSPHQFSFTEQHVKKSESKIFSTAYPGFFSSHVFFKTILSILPDLLYILIKKITERTKGITEGVSDLIDFLNNKVLLFRYYSMMPLVPNCLYLNYQKACKLHGKYFPTYRMLADFFMGYYVTCSPTVLSEYIQFCGLPEISEDMRLGVLIESTPFSTIVSCDFPLSFRKQIQYSHEPIFAVPTYQSYVNNLERWQKEEIFLLYIANNITGDNKVQSSKNLSNVVEKITKWDMFPLGFIGYVLRQDCFLVEDLFLQLLRNYFGNNWQRTRHAGYQNGHVENAKRLNMDIAKPEFYFQHKAVRLRPSSVHGYGVFASESIHKGDWIIEYVGLVVSEAVADKWESLYTYTIGGSTYFFKLGNNDIIDATQCGNITRFINHSCNPNCRPIDFGDFEDDATGWHVVISALCDIECGKELFYNYRLSEGVFGKEKCCCGSANCIGLL